MSAVLFGQVDSDTGAVQVAWGETNTRGKDNHAVLGMVSRPGLRFRYVVDDQVCYWWEEPNDALKACAEHAVSSSGHTVTAHHRMFRGSEVMLRAHRWST